MIVYVLDYDGTPLMPTKRLGHVRWLLKTGQAVVVKKEPFTIRLTTEKKRYTQDITLGGNVKGKVTDTKEPESAENSPEANSPEGLPPEAEAAETAVMQENEENDDGE